VVLHTAWEVGERELAEWRRLRDRSAVDKNQGSDEAGEDDERSERLIIVHL